MKIVDRKTFLQLDKETLYSKYEPCYFSDLTIKCISNMSDDFVTQGITNAIECDNGQEHIEILSNSEKNGTSFTMDFDCPGRDGCFDEDQLFAIWEKEDIEKLIERLKILL